MSALWFSPVCDDVLRIVTAWYRQYERGEIESTRPYLTLTGVIEDRPTRYAHKLALRTVEVAHLRHIMETLAPASEVTKEVVKLQSGLQRGRLLPGGRYLVTVAYWKKDVEEILTTLQKAAQGQITTMEHVLETQQELGKDLFEA